MAATNGETMSSTSATAHNSNDRPMQPASRGRQHNNRPRRHNPGPCSQTTVHPVLTSDRQKQPGAVSSQQSSQTTRPPRKPPGLSTPPLKPADDTNGTDMDDDEELCFICGNSMKERYFSLAPCGNAFCHICSLRLRALYKSTNCPFCKTEHDTVIFANTNDRAFTDYELGAFEKKDEKLGILFETQQILEDTMLLLRFNCPDTSCDVACRNWQALKAHVKSIHHRYLCSLCTQHKKVFTHEHILYTSRELTTHFSTGDPIKDISLTGFTGHPKCRFCNQSLYSFDEFHAHNRERHERCHVCDQINTRRALPDAQPRYFINYDELWKHFQTEHFPCGAPECLEARFVVFESDIDLKAHIMEVHMGHASKAELRDMRRVDVNFRYTSGAPSVGRGRGRREEERRDVDISTLPRDEQAYFRIQQAQREMASRQIGNVNIPSPRIRESFPALPTSSPAIPSERAHRPVPVERFPPLSGPSRPSAPPTPAPSSLPPQVAARHAAVLEKAAHLLNNDKDKLAQFKSHVSAFRHSESSASDLIDRLWDIFNAKLEEFGKLITSTADLFDYDAKPKRSELLGAWNDWKIQMQETNSAASSGFIPQQAQRSRILALKSSARGRPAGGAQGVWNRLEAVAASRPFPGPGPSLPQSMGALNLNSSTRPPVAWNPSSQISHSVAARTVAARPVASMAARPFAAEEFPSLPNSKPRERVVLNAAAGPARPVVSWGEARGEENVQAVAPVEPVKGKGKKKGKQILFHVG